MTRARVVVARGVEQQRALDAWLAATPRGVRAVIAEAGLAELRAPDDITVIRLFAGCVCCVGAVALRVALVRLLQKNAPQQVLLIISDDGHLERVRAILTDGSLGVSLVTA